MRLYLERLRKEAGLSVKEADKLLYLKTGIRLRCRSIETGHYWAEITPKRAAILADVYSTTADDILELEKTEGQYEGQDYFASSTQTNDTSVYDKVLTEDEKALIIEYYSYVKVVVKQFQYKVYYDYVKDGILSFADIEELGILGFVRGIKRLTRLRKTDADYIAGMETEEGYIKWLIKRSMQTQIMNEVRKALCEKRKSFTRAKYFEDGVLPSGDSDDDYNLYGITPSKDIPIERLAESSYILSVLYSYLDSTQIHICDLLIAGYSKKYLIESRHFSPSDLGIITFYLQQIVRFGKVKWRKEEYVSGMTNVYYDFRCNRWEVKASYKGTVYHLATYSDINTAFDLQVVSNALRASGKFLPWYEKHLVYDESAQKKIFTYPMQGDEEEYQELTSKPITRIYANAADEKNLYGIAYKSCGKYEVQFRRTYLGRVDTLEEALELRKLAELKYSTGEYDAWIADIKRKQHELKEVGIYISYLKARDLYSVDVHRKQCKKTYIGSYKTKEEAEKVKREALIHVEKGDFDSWLTEYKSACRDVARTVGKPNLAKITYNKNRGRFEVGKTIKHSKSAFIASFKTKAEAEACVEIANVHILAGDFDDWLPRYKAQIKSDKSANKVIADNMSAPKLSFFAQYALSKYIASTALCYKIICYDIADTEQLICETADIDEATEVMNQANAHIEAGDFDVWIADYKKI